jgi:hypothetical protein
MTDLWHMSEDDSIQRFEPRSNSAHDSDDALVWAIDSEHAPAYWFPRECPRGTFWAVDTTTDADVERFLLGDRSLRVHAVQGDWLAAVRAARVTRTPGSSYASFRAFSGCGDSSPTRPSSTAVSASGTSRTG